MGKSKKEVSKDVPHFMVCDEGGTHDFRFAKEINCCDRLLCVFCFPCYAICSCALSEGAALANPMFEQMCCSKARETSDEPGMASCRKCGLTETEAKDLSDVRDIEASQGKRTTGYFSNAMSMPSAATSNNPNQISPTSPTRPNTHDHNHGNPTTHPDEISEQLV